MDSVNCDILIADAGGTTTSWALITHTEDGVHSFVRESCGINAAHLSEREIKDCLRDIAREGMLDGVAKVYFYGAGCAGDIQKEKVRIALRSLCGERPEINVNGDLLGAARALFGTGDGVACILGTGSASGVYDGRHIVRFTPSLGYVVGDEGSGAALGKRLCCAVYKRLCSEKIRDDFFGTYDLPVDKFIENVYRCSGANAYLAGFAPFIAEHIHHEKMAWMVRDEFCNFLKRNVLGYARGGYQLPAVGFVGGIASAFRKQLSEACELCDVELAGILASPIEGLIRYHSKNP